MGSFAFSAKPRALPEEISMHRADTSLDEAWVIDAYRANFRYVWALLGRLGVPPGDVEDVVQEVFLVLHRRRGEFRNESSVRTWLHGIAVRKARRHRERQRRRQHEPLTPEREPSTHTSVEAQVSSKQSLQLVDRLLAELPDEQREVFVLSDLSGIRCPEISVLLGVKLNTVYSRLRLARKCLRSRYSALVSEPTRREDQQRGAHHERS